MRAAAAVAPPGAPSDPDAGVRVWSGACDVLICAHDAGGAEILSEWELANPGKRYRHLLAGPAVAVFRRKFADLEILETGEADAALAETDFLLTGTSWASTLEVDCLRQARLRGVFSASFLDHWVNYAGRFSAGGVSTHPDEIWVGDGDAFDLARRTFPDRVVRLQPNPYFDRIRREFAQSPAPDAPTDEVRLLYVCEPIAIDRAAATRTQIDTGYTEFDALAFCLDRLSAIVPPRAGCRIRVRLHPSEKPGKYGPVLDRYRSRLAIDISSGTTLLDDCRWSTDVAGCGSMAMMIALLGGRRVFSSIPVAGVACPLPNRAIRYLRDLAAGAA